MQNFKPMLARNVDLEKLQVPCAVQKKWDGERLIYKDGQFLSRSMKPITNLWLIGQLQEILENFHLPLDGEIQVDGTFANTSGFVRKSDRQGDFIYHVFDMPMEGMNYLERHNLLGDHIDMINDPRIQIVPYTLVETMDELMEIHSEYAADPALDGTITRDLSTFYKCGRATVTEGQVMKMKDFEDDEGLIIGFTERMHNTNEAQTNELGRTFRSSAQDGLEPTGLLATYIVEWNGVQFNVTATGDLASRELRWKNKDEYLGKLVKFQFQGVGNNGAPRFPVELGIRDKEDLS